MKRIKHFGMICAAVFTLLCIPALQVKAGTIQTVEATGSTTGVNITGQADTGVLAVVVQVRDSSDNILTMETFGVVSGSYQASIVMNLAAGDYKVYVADFVGGDWCTDEFTVTASTGGNNGTGGGNGSNTGSENGDNNNESADSSNDNNSGHNVNTSGTGNANNQKTGNSGNKNNGNTTNKVENERGETDRGETVETTESKESMEESKEEIHSESDSQTDASQSAETEVAQNDFKKPSDSERESGIKAWQIALTAFLTVVGIVIIGGILYIRRKNSEEL